MSIKLVFVLQLTLICYSPLWLNGFTYEDPSLVTQAAQPIRQIVFGRRPLTVLSLWADRRLFGETPLGWHLTSLGIHLTNGVLVAALASALGLTGWIAAGLFLLHPIQVEAVASLNGRGELLVTLGLLLALWAFTWKKPLHAAVGVILGSLLAVASKESAVVLFGLLLLIAWRIHRGTEHLGSAILLLVAFLVAFAPAVLLLGDLWQHPAQPILEWASLQATAIWRYLGLIVWPFGFSVEHEFEHVPLAIRHVLLATWLVLPLALWRQRIPRMVYVGMLWWWICLFPRLVVPLPNGAFLSEHQVYTATVGLALAGASLWKREVSHV